MCGGDVLIQRRRGKVWASFRDKVVPMRREALSRIAQHNDKLEAPQRRAVHPGGNIVSADLFRDCRFPSVRAVANTLQEICLVANFVRINLEFRSPKNFSFAFCEYGPVVLRAN